MTGDVGRKEMMWKWDHLFNCLPQLQLIYKWKVFKIFKCESPRRILQMFYVLRDDAAEWVTQLVCSWLWRVKTLQDCLLLLGTPLLSFCLKHSELRWSLILSSCWDWETPSSVKPIPGCTCENNSFQSGLTEETHPGHRQHHPIV